MGMIAKSNRPVKMLISDAPSEQCQVKRNTQYSQNVQSTSRLDKVMPILHARGAWPAVPPKNTTRLDHVSCMVKFNINHLKNADSKRRVLENLRRKKTELLLLMSLHN